MMTAPLSISSLDGIHDRYFVAQDIDVGAETDMLSKSCCIWYSEPLSMQACYIHVLMVYLLVISWSAHQLRSSSCLVGYYLER
jgi:hypothetical protein